MISKHRDCYVLLMRKYLGEKVKAKLQIEVESLEKVSKMF